MELVRGGYGDFKFRSPLPDPILQILPLLRLPYILDFNKGHGTSTWHKKIQVLTFTLPIQDFKLLPLNSSSDLTAIKSSANFSDHTRACTDFGLS